MNGIINFISCGLCLGFSLGASIYQEEPTNWLWMIMICGFINLFMGFYLEFLE